MCIIYMYIIICFIVKHRLLSPFRIVEISVSFTFTVYLDKSRSRHFITFELLVCAM